MLLLYFLAGVFSNIGSSMDTVSMSLHDFSEFRPVVNEYVLEYVIDQDVKLIMGPDKNVNEPLDCKRGCGQNGFCFNRFCYNFPFEKYQVSYGTLVKTDMGSLEEFRGKCDEAGTYWHEHLLEDGICLSAQPICKHNSDYKNNKCFDTEDCRMNEKNSRDYYQKYQFGFDCVSADVSENICCQEDPEVVKCPNKLFPLLFQPKYDSGCEGLNHKGFCCPNTIDRKGVVHNGESSFFTGITCEPTQLPVGLIPMSGCVDGNLVIFPTRHVAFRRTGHICNVLTSGEFYNECIKHNETCVVLDDQNFACVNSTLDNLPELEFDFTYTKEEWIWASIVISADVLMLLFTTYTFVCVMSFNSVLQTQNKED